MAEARFPRDAVPSMGRRPGFAASALMAGILSGVAAGCASAPSRQGLRIDVAGIVREADAEVDRGCYLCLRSAAEKYETAIAAGAKSLDLAAAGAWTLLSVRERELGLRPSDALDRARSHAPLPAPGRRGRPGETTFPGQDPGEVIEAYVRVASTVPPLREGVSMEASTAAARAARELMEGGSLESSAAGSLSARGAMAAPGERPDPPAIALLRRRAKSGDDRAASYLVESLGCSSAFRSAPGSPEAEAGGPAESQSGLMAFLSATCRDRAQPARDAEVLGRLLEREPRFHEAHFFLGRLVLADRKLVSAEREFLAAADGLPAMTAAWAMLGGARLLMEEYEWAALDIGRALHLEPDQREALLAHARALNYAGRFEAALAPARRLLDLGAWYVSDANYWLAFSELQLGRLQDADGHVREAKRTNPMNGDTARLTGLVAHRLAQFDRAQAEFELAVSRNNSDCESHLHLGMIHGQKERFDASIDSFVRARDCYGDLAEIAGSRRREIETSSLPESRKDAAMARLAQRVRGYRSAQAAASLGAAEGEAQRGGFDQALGHLRDAESEAALGGRVGELRTRIAALRARR